MPTVSIPDVGNSECSLRITEFIHNTQKRLQVSENQQEKSGC